VLPAGEDLHLAQAAPDHHDEDDVLEQDPEGVLKKAPPLGARDPVHRVRPREPADEVVSGDGDGCGEDDPPVPVAGQERERSEHVEVGLDATAGQMDEESGPQDLRKRDGVPGDGVP
jgi:hypothetical protein